MSKSNALAPVILGIAGAAAAGVFAYAFARRTGGDAPPKSQPRAVEAPPLRESMVVPRNHVPDPLEVDLDLDGVFRGVEADLEEPTVQQDTRPPPVAGADDAEPPGPEDLGAYWLTRATQSERSLSEGELSVDLDNIADLREDLEDDDPEEEEHELPLALGRRRG